ncbi:hypothetical protein [Rhodoferax antarcticus]|uniref:hypothetical protein n=1 Tax=Rhodoferax antarcticus TaxID=81479 RepID=UPI00111517C0|nr:hypothetical protein [Rhodoferax antarcticus]
MKTQSVEIMPKSLEALDSFASVAIIIDEVYAEQKAAPRVSFGCYSSQMLSQIGRPDDRNEVCKLAGVTTQADATLLGAPRRHTDPILLYRGLTCDLKPPPAKSTLFGPCSLSEDIADLYSMGVDTHSGSGAFVFLTTSKSLVRVTPHANSLA